MPRPRQGQAEGRSRRSLAGQLERAAHPLRQLGADREAKAEAALVAAAASALKALEDCGFEAIDNIPLAIDWRRHLLLIFKEAMSNAAKHASCANVTLELTLKEGVLTIRLADDGKGFDPQAPAAGQGLGGMKKRVEKIHGDLKIESIPGKGTVVEFSGKVPQNLKRE